MNIGFDGKRLVNNSTGLGEYSRNTVYALATHNPEHNYVIFHDNLNKSANLSGLTEVIYKKPFYFRTYGLGNFAAKQKIQIFHGLSNEIPFDLPKTIKGVCTIHDVIFKHFPDYYSFIDRNIYNLKTKNAVKKADLIIATSNTTKQDLIELYAVNEQRIKVVYQPVNSYFYSTEILSNYKKPQINPYLLYISSFNERKNHGRLIEAFYKIHKQTDFNMILAGSLGSTYLNCLNQIKAYKMGERIEILTNISHEKKMELLVNANGFIYPSIYEGFGIPLMEAAACSIPIAASNIAIFNEIGGDCVSYFNPYKTELIADALLNLIQQPVKENKSILSKIQTHFIANQLVDIYSSLI